MKSRLIRATLSGQLDHLRENRPSIQRLCDHAQILPERPRTPRLRASSVGARKSDDGCTVTSVFAAHSVSKKWPTILGDTDPCAEERLCRSRAEAHDHARLHDLQLCFHPWPAGGDVPRGSASGAAAAFPRLPLEVLHHVRDVTPLPVDPHLFQRPVQKLPRRPDEWMARAILLISRLFARAAPHPHCRGPSPKTVCVAFRYSGQAVQPAAASRTSPDPGSQAAAPGATPAHPSVSTRSR